MKQRLLELIKERDCIFDSLLDTEDFSTSFISAITGSGYISDDFKKKVYLLKEKEIEISNIKRKLEKKI